MHAIRDLHNYTDHDGDVVVFAYGCCCLTLVSSNECMVDRVTELPLYHRHMEIIITATPIVDQE